MRGTLDYDNGKAHDINVDTLVVHGEPRRKVRRVSVAVGFGLLTSLLLQLILLLMLRGQVDCEITYSSSSCSAGDCGFHATVSQAQQPAATFLDPRLTD